MDIVEQIKQVAASVLRNAISVGPDQDGFFRLHMPVSVGGETKPLLIVGNAHHKAGDGHCTAVLNPDASLMDKIRPGVGYTRQTLIEMVTKRCDVALDIWLDSGEDDGVSVTAQYRARKFQPAKFCVA
jgi:hypothetical protein